MSAEKRRFRPMSISDILDETIDLFKSNFALLVGVAALLYVPMTIITGMTQDYSRRATLDWASMLLWLPQAIVTGALTIGVSECYLGRYASIAECYRRILNPQTIGRLLGAMLIKAAIMFVPFVTVYILMQAAMPTDPRSMSFEQSIRLSALAVLMLPAVIWMCVFGIRLLLVEQTVVLESTGILHSLGRSWKLMRGFFWKAVGIFAIVGLVAGIIYVAIVMPAMGPVISKTAKGLPVSRSLLVLPTILQTLVMTLVAPITAVTPILFYYDVRIRKEGFDLELLASELDQKARQDVSGDISSLPQERPSDGEQQ